MRKVTVNFLDGQNMIRHITVEVPDNATLQEIEEAVKEILRGKNDKEI